jgi:hypothetical protein
MTDNKSSASKPIRAVKPASKPVVLKPMAESHQMSQKPTSSKKG